MTVLDTAAACWEASFVRLWFFCRVLPLERVSYVICGETDAIVVAGIVALEV
jgi:hypothetical protein